MCINLRGKFDGFLHLLLIFNLRMHNTARWDYQITKLTFLLACIVTLKNLKMCNGSCSVFRLLLIELFGRVNISMSMYTFSCTKRITRDVWDVSVSLLEMSSARVQHTTQVNKPIAIVVSVALRIWISIAVILQSKQQQLYFSPQYNYFSLRSMSVIPPVSLHPYQIAATHEVSFQAIMLHTPCPHSYL